MRAQRPFGLVPHTLTRRGFLRLAMGGLCGLALSGNAVVAPLAEVEIVLSEDAALYTDAAQEIRQELGSDVRVSTVLAETVERRDKAGAPSMIVVLGTRALSTVVARDHNVPVIAALVPRKAYESTLAVSRPAPHTVSAVYLDQPYARQLNLIHLMLPSSSRVGVLASPEWEGQLDMLQAVAHDQRFTLVRETVVAPRDLHRALQKMLGEVDSVLALPDSSVFNASTLPNVLLTSYRKQQPVFGFSPAYVRAGALAAVYSTPQQNARQVAEMAQRVLSGGDLPPPQYSRSFWVSVNATVARSLDIKVTDEATLVAELLKMERE